MPNKIFLTKVVIFKAAGYFNKLTAYDIFVSP